MRCPPHPRGVRDVWRRGHNHDRHAPSLHCIPPPMRYVPHPRGVRGAHTRRHNHEQHAPLLCIPPPMPLCFLTARRGPPLSCPLEGCTCRQPCEGGGGSPAGREIRFPVWLAARIANKRRMLFEDSCSHDTELGAHTQPAHAMASRWQRCEHDTYAQDYCCHDKTIGARTRKGCAMR